MLYGCFCSQHETAMPPGCLGCACKEERGHTTMRVRAVHVEESVPMGRLKRTVPSSIPAENPKTDYCPGTEFAIYRLTETEAF